MGIFGWSLPPGCGSLPGEEEDAIEIKSDELPAGTYAFWLEDGMIELQIEGEYIARIGPIEWTDDLSEEENIAAAVEFLNNHLKGV